MFRFASPFFLILFIIIPFAVRYRKRRPFDPALGMSDTVALEGIRPSLALRAARLLPLLKYTAFCLMIIALARPQWGTRKENVMTKGINIVMALDLSGSMAALDFQEGGKTFTRLDAVKGVIQDFVSKREGDRIGLVVFGSEAYTQLPLTRDYHTIVSVLDRLRIGAAGPNTAIGDAVGISLKRLADIESESNIIILLTDGQSNSGELNPDTAVRIAADKKVKIYTVGVGSRGRVPFLVKDPLFGERYVYRDVDMDEEALKKIAGVTGGIYFHAKDMAGLEKIYETIDRLEKTEVKVRIYAEYKEYYRLLLLPAFCLFGLWILLSNTRFLKVP